MVVVALFLLLVAVRATAPVDFFEGDQQKQVGYVTDILHNGHWLVQYEVTGKIATKPPFYDWAAAIFALLFHSTNPWVMKLPSLLAGMGLLLILYRLAAGLFDRVTGFWTVVVCLASHHFIKLVWFARTDMLMTLALYGAIYVVMRCGPAVGASIGAGMLLGIGALIKGPAAPALFLAWLPVWIYRSEAYRRPASVWKLLPGAAIFAAIAGAWLAGVWNMPLFQEEVLSQEIAIRVPWLAQRSDPFYYYVPLLFARVAPWTFVAAAASFFARKRAEWPTVRFLVLWVLAMLALLTIVPEKRHDLLLPVYPPVFMLAALGIRYVTESRPVPWLLWLAAPFAAALVLLPAAMPFLMKQPASPMVWGFSAAAAMAGAAAIVCRAWPRAMIVCVCAGMIIFHGLYHFGLANSHPVDLYPRLEAFTDSVREKVGSESLRVWKTHPLISYELGVHVPDGPLEELARQRPGWIVTEEDLTGRISSATGWTLKEEARLSMRERFAKVNAGLYKVERKNGEAR